MKKENNAEQSSANSQTSEGREKFVHNEKGIEITEKMKEVVIARIEAQVPFNYKLYIGSYGGLNKEELIEHVKKGDKIGEFIVKAHLSFMKALASGEFIKAINSVEDE